VLFGIVSPVIKIKSLDRDTIAIATCTVLEPDPNDESRRGTSTCTAAMACTAASPPLFAPPWPTAVEKAAREVAGGGREVEMSLSGGAEAVGR
jgi:hypothetical protein